MGSDLKKCVILCRRPCISAWDAAMYMAMGVAAHQSAQRDGEIVKVIELGKKWD